LEAFVRIESTHFSKPLFSFFTPHTTKSKNLAKTPKSPNLVYHQPFEDQFLVLQKFYHITLEAFVRFESSHIFKTMILVFQSANHQVKKSTLNTKITIVGYAPSIRRSIPCASKILPHHFGGICEV